MAFIDWLRKQHEESERNRRLFENRPGTLRAGEVPTHQMVRASRAWGGGPGSGSGYQDREGGQNLMVRQPRFGRPPPDSVTLTEKDDGTSTRVTKWDKQLKATALPPGSAMSSGGPIPPPRNQRNPLFTGQHMYDRGRMSPEMQAAVAQVQATGGRNVDAYGDPLGVDVSNQRAMYHALRRPNPQVVPPMRGDIGATQSIGVPNQDPRMRGMRPSIMNTGNWSDNLGNWYMNWRQKMIEADKRRRQRGNY